jgi:predicted ester cyclase
MSQSGTLHLAQEFLARMGSNAEPAEIAKLFSEKLDWEIAGDTDVLPWIGRKIGRAAITDFVTDSRANDRANQLRGSRYSGQRQSSSDTWVARIQNQANGQELFADDFVDHTPQPNMTADKAGVRKLYSYIRDAFPDFHAKIHWQLADGDRVTTYKTYFGTHEGDFLGVAPTHRQIHFETADVMRVRDGKITDHWGVGNLFSLMQQLGVLNL